MLPLLILALSLRLGVLALLPGESPDAATYRQAGIDLFERGTIAFENVMPLYPLWTYVTGGGIGLRLADVALSVATVWIIFQLALEIFREERVALIAAAIAAVYPMFLFQAGQGATETAFTFLLCAAFLALYRARYLVASVLLVLAILTRPALDLLAPLLIVVFSAVIHRDGWQVTWKRLAGYLAVYAILMLPWWMHNYAKYGEFVRLNLADGGVIAEGNLCPPDDPGWFEEIRQLKDCRDIQWPAGANPIEANRAVNQTTVAFMLDHPSYSAKVLLVKAFAFWRPYANSADWRYRAAYLLSYGTVLALAIAFLIFDRRSRSPRLAPAALLIAYWFAVHLITISQIRYRFPIEPFLIVIAAAAIAAGRPDSLIRTH